MASESEIKRQINQLGTDVVELKVEVARQGEQIKNMDSKLDDVCDGVKSIQDSLLTDAKGSNKLLKGWMVKLLILLLAGGVGGTAVTSVVSAMSDPAPVTVESLDP